MCQQPAPFPFVFLYDVEVGQRTPFEAEIKSDLKAGAEVIVHPSNELADGTRVELQGK